MLRKFSFLIAFCLAVLPICAQTNSEGNLLFTSFDSETDLELWTVIDADKDGSTWQYGSLWGKDDSSNKRSGAEVYRQNTGNDDWLISPAVTLSSGQASLIEAKFFRGYYGQDYIDVCIALDGTEPADAKVVGTIEIKGTEGGYYGKAIEKSLAIPAVDADGDYRIYFHYTAAGNASGYQDGVHINDFSWTSVESTATVSGTVIYRMDMGGSPFDMKANGATVTIGELTALTGSDGTYTITDIPAGEYDMTVRYIQGTSIGRRHISVNEGDNLTEDFVLTQVFKYNLGGTVKDETGKPVCGAAIIIDGYDTDTAFTDTDGKYNFNVFESEYNVTVRKNNYIAQNTTINLSGSDKTDVDFTLDVDILPPYNVTAADDADLNVKVAWDAPKSLAEIAYDNGVGTSSYGFGTVSDESHVMGTIFREPGTLYEINWQTAEYAEGSANEITLSVVALDEEGNPTTNLLHQARVQTVHGQWNNYRLPEPIEMGTGVMVLVGGVNARLALDGGTEDGTIDHPRTQVYNNLGINSPGGYYYFDDRLSDQSCHFLLRAVCEASLEPDGATLPDMTFDVWRLPVSAQDDESKWTKIGTNIDEYSCTDTEALSGEYRYAVKAVYGAIGTSSATVTDIVAHNMIANVTVTVSADSDPEHAEGAQVKLHNDFHTYTAVVTAGVAKFANVEKGEYSLTITQNGFKTIEDEIEVIGEDVSFSKDFTLEQTLDLPANLDVIVDGNSAHLLWNKQLNIFDNFDGDDYIDFEVDPAGRVGWQYIDGDRLYTYGFTYTVFPHMRERMAAITFNSFKTTPPLGEEEGAVINTAYSGERALAFFAVEATETEDEEIIINASNDYFISPELNPYKDFKFTFYARTYDEVVEGYRERIRVGYSTTTADIDQFKWLDNELQYVPLEYTKYEYTIPQEAKYVVLNSSSLDNFMLLVDDVFIGVEEQVQGNSYMPVNVEGYEVYLNDEKKLDTNDTEYTFTGLADGTYTAAVVQKFATGNSEKLSITFNIGTSGVNGLEGDDVLSIYAYGDMLHVTGDYSHAGIYSTSGAQVMTLAGEQTADISALPRGVYIVKVVKADGSDTTAKIIK